MAASTYSPKLHNHYSNPQNVGTLDEKSEHVGTGMVGSPACGDVMRFQIEVVNGVIVNAKFKTFGCGSAIASSSLATTKVIGKTVEEASKITNEEIAEELVLPPVKLHCSVLAQEALALAIADLVSKKEEAINE